MILFLFKKGSVMQANLSRVLSLNFMGCLWGFLGMNLIRKGLPIIFQSGHLTLAVVLTLAAVTIGCFKSLFVLKKTATRLTSRIHHVKSFFSIFKIMDLKFLILIVSMMLLGMSLRFVGGFDMAKGVIRIAVGYALLQSSFYFFRPAFIYGIRG
jgi:hypothetical protein